MCQYLLENKCRTPDGTVCSGQMTKINLFVYIFGENQRQHISLEEPDTNPKACGRDVMVWGYLAASRLGHLSITDSTINSSLYQRVLEGSVRTIARRLKFSRKWTLQHLY